MVHNNYKFYVCEDTKFQKPYSKIKQNLLCQKAGFLRLEMLNKIGYDVDFTKSEFTNLIKEKNLEELYEEYIEIRNDLVDHNYKLIFKVALREDYIFKDNHDIEDFIFYYILEAVEKYFQKYYSLNSDEKPCRLSSFIYRYSGFMIKRRLQNNDELLSMPKKYVIKYHQIKKLMRNVDDIFEIAEKLDIDKETIEDILRAHEEILNIDKVNYEDIIPMNYNEDINPLDSIIEEEDFKELKRILKELPEAQMKVINLRYYENNTYEQIGKKLGISGESARRGEKKTIDIIKYLKK